MYTANHQACMNVMLLLDDSQGDMGCSCWSAFLLSCAIVTGKAETSDPSMQWYPIWGLILLCFPSMGGNAQQFEDDRCCGSGFGVQQATS